VNDAVHRHVPVGTIADHEGTPVTVFRDYSHALIPKMDLNIAGVDQLAAILPGLRAQMVAAEAEERAENAALPECEQSTNCEACWHLWSLHTADGCGAQMGDTLTGRYTCPCEHAPAEAPLTATERIDLALHGAEIVTAAFQDDDDPCEFHGGEGEGSTSCAECRADAGLEDEDGNLCGDEWWPPRNGDGSYGEPPQYCDQPADHDGDHGMSGGTSWPQDNDDDSGRDRQRFGRAVY
jgi:hypothetical protein